MPDHNDFIRIRNYIIIATEPVHVGAGGYRLGRVDNTIIREPGSNLPKLPGTGIAGVVRSYTAMALDIENPGNMNEYKFRRPVPKRDAEGNGMKNEDGQLLFEFVSCAGKGGDDGKGHCGKPDCAVCVAFGFSKKESSFQGLAAFSDAHILFFPVNSMKGPVWITARQPLQQFIEDNAYSEVEKPLVIEAPPGGEADEGTHIITDLLETGERLNLGWLLFQNQQKRKPVVLKDALNSTLPVEMLQRTVLVSDQVFSRLVNDNLEVRTSVAIDPATGAADEGALYTYEALPRSTVLWFPIRYLNPEKFQVAKGDVSLEWENMQRSVEKGIKLMEILGVGGKGTRGMGRVRCLNMRNGG